MNTNQTIGVTGSTGFIGTHLVRFLTGTGYQVVPIDEGVTESFFSKRPVRTIVHLSATSRPPLAHMLEKNLLFTARVLEAARKGGLEKVIYTSTGAVYGEGEGRTFTEDDEPNPMSAYGLTKWFAEEYIRFLERTAAISSVILRFTNVYGPGEYRGVIHHFITDALATGGVTVTGDGNQRRNFLHVTDACRAIGKAIVHPSSGTFNIGNPTSVTLNDVVRILRKIRSVSVRYVPEDTTTPKGNALDTTKAATVLSFTPEEDFTRSLSELLSSGGAGKRTRAAKLQR